MDDNYNYSLAKVNLCNVAAFCDIRQETYLIRLFPDWSACGLRHIMTVNELKVNDNQFQNESSSAVSQSIKR